MTKFINIIKFAKNYFSFSFLAVIFLGSSWALFQPGFFRAHDYVHGARIAEMSKAITDGHFPVRWSQNFGYGFGMPLFEFYAPLPFYVGSVFYLAGVDLILSVKLLFIIANLGSLIGAYLLGKELSGYRGGILLSAAFTLAPYRAVNLFVRGSISEAWGIMALPWIAAGIIQTIKNPSKKSFLTLTLSLVVLMLSHNLTTLMFVPLSFIYAVGYIFIFQKKNVDLLKKIGHVSLGYMLAIGLSSFYLLPAFIEKKLTQIDTIIGGYFHYSNHFLYIRQFLVENWGYGGSGWGPNDGISFFLGFGQLISLAIAGLISLFLIKKVIKEKTGSHRQEFLHLALVVTVLIFSLFMTLLKSKWAWDNLPLLNYIQFPWRFLATAILFLAIIAAIVLKLLNSVLLRTVYFVAIYLAIILGNFYYFRPEKMMDNPSDLYYGNEAKIRAEMSGVLKDYIPVQMNYEGNILRTQYNQFQFPQDTTTILNRTHQKIYSLSLTSDQLVSFPIANFPNWTIEVDGKKTASLTNSIGLLAANIPSGKHTVSLNFANSPVRNIADTISAISLLSLLSYLLFRKLK
ncbi:hypothetical protein KJZ63_04725 [Patescibacteria group bacterium]|nr:hypothetical protein [Patescibacteria group bacterium]